MSLEDRARASMVSYWTRFAGEARLVTGAPALTNPRAGLVGPNAGYPVSPEQVEDLDRWYASLGRPGVLVVTAGSEVERVALAMGFRQEGELEVVEARPGEPTEDVWVEQVGWSLGSTLGQVLAEVEGLPEWAPALAVEIARVMQEDVGNAAYLALDGGRALGALVLVEGAAHLWGALDDDRAVSAALLGRAAGDAGALLMTSVGKKGTSLPAAVTAGRFVVLVND